MATSVHYIRTIHTSFTAAHPHSSSAWVNPRLYNPTPVPTGRKRSASIRMPLKFDPFAEDSSDPVLYNSAVPYTIHIPPAAPADIQRHHQQQFAYRQQPTLRVRSARPQQPPQPVQRITVVAPNATAIAAREREQRSKIVAGILLNRVHAVGKPMRRRASDQPRPYVPSGLSTCIAIEA